MKEKRLYRSCKNRIIGGVCGGLGEYFDIDPVLVRLITALLIFTGVSIVFYILAWIIIPEDPSCHPASEKKAEPKVTSSEIDNKEQKVVRLHNEDGRYIAGIIIIVLGILFLFQNTMGFHAWELFWPLILIVVGLLFIFRAKA